MCSFDAESLDRSWDEPLPAEVESDEQDGPCDEWADFQPQPPRDDVWDAFELDEETAEPQPEYGDFWGELDEEEPV
jgi:hypothetical protein